MCQQGTPCPDPHTRLRNGLRSDLLGDRWLAIQSLEDLLREFPDFHEARGHLAWIYSLQGNNPAAIEHLKYLVREADNPIAHDRILELEEEMAASRNQDSGSEAIYRRARKLAEDTTRTAKNSRREALVLFRGLWEAEDYRDTGEWVSRLACILQDFPTSLRATQTCLTKDPGSLALRKRLGLVQEFLGYRDEAIETYRECLARDPHAKGIRINLILLEKEASEETLCDSNLRSALLEIGQESSGLKGKTFMSRLRSFFRSDSQGRLAERVSQQLTSNSGFENRPCNLCQGTDFEGVAVGRENGWPIQRCLQCGLIQTHPQPTQATLTKKYQESYYGERSLEVARGIHDALPIGGRPLTMLPRIMDFLLDQGLQEFEDSLPERRLLDVGCGEGVLMRDFRNRGWECEGTEVSSPAIDFLRERGYGVHEGLLGELSLQMRAYDIVTLSHVIEHVRDPLGDLRRIHSLLKPGGWAFLTTPGADSLTARIAGADWFYDPDHIFFFSRATLKHSMQTAGFEVFGEASYVGAGRETWEEAWLREGLGPLVKERIEEQNQGDVLLMVGRKG